MINTERLLKKLSKAQLHCYKKLSNDCQRMQYLATFINPSSRNAAHINLPREGRGKDEIKPNRILYLMLRRNRELYSLNADKRPLEASKSVHYGIEVECIFKRGQFPDANVSCECECYCTRVCGECEREHEDFECDGECLENCKCRPDYEGAIVNMLCNTKLKNVQVAADGSLTHDDEYFGVEFRVLVTLEDYSNLKRLLAWIESMEGFVDKSCGLHVHMDARSTLYGGSKDAVFQERMTLANNLNDSLPLLVAMQPDSRRENSYCKYGASENDRYYMINLTSLDKHQTIEVRLHSGTVNLTKIINWVHILHSIRTQALTLENYIAVLPNELVNYIAERLEKFGDKQAVLKHKETVAEELTEAVSTLTQHELYLGRPPTAGIYDVPLRMNEIAATIMGIDYGAIEARIACTLTTEDLMRARDGLLTGTGE